MTSLNPMKTENIKLIIKPGSSVSEVCGIYDGRIKIKLSSVPEKGRANKELIKFISNKTGIPGKNIKIIAGEKSIYKEISVNYNNNLDLTAKLLSD
jgi:hypothetical protein